MRARIAFILNSSLSRRGGLLEAACPEWGVVVWRCFAVNRAVAHVHLAVNVYIPTIHPLISNSGVTSCYIIGF